MRATKLIGTYQPAGILPPWVSIGMAPSWIADTALAEAVSRSRETGMLWVVQFGFDLAPTVPIGPYAHGVRARLEGAGLWPYVVAVTYGEEWQERFAANEFAPYGLPASTQGGGDVVRRWVGRQQRELHEITRRPVMHVATFVYRVPEYTHFAALDAYVPDGADPVKSLAGIVMQAEEEAEARSLPLVIIPRWFQYTSAAQGAHWESYAAPPTAEMADVYAQILARPAWVAAVGFLAGSRPGAGLRGLNDIPGGWAQVESALRAHGLLVD